MTGQQGTPPPLHAEPVGVHETCMAIGGNLRNTGSRSRNASGTSARKAAVSAAHEVKKLRSEAQQLDEELSVLCAKWKAALPEREVLLAACTAAKQKADTGRVEQLNHQLKDKLLQQQLYFSALQQKLTEAPLWSRAAFCQELFDRMHGYLHLVGSDHESRRKQLQARFDLGVRLAPELVKNFAREFVPLASNVLPFSRTSTAATAIPSPFNAHGGINGTDCGTLVSNVFVCKVPVSASIPRIFQNVVDSIKDASIELERRLGVLFEVKYEVAMGKSTYYARVERQDGEMRGAHANRAWTGKLVSDDLAVIVTDFVDEDDEDAPDGAWKEGQEIQVGSDGVPLIPPTPASRICIDTCMMLTIARVKDPETQEPCVLLRRLRVHRYNLPPNSPLIHRELKKLLSYFNGDFHMGMLSDAYTNKNNADHFSAAESARSDKKTRRDEE